MRKASLKILSVFLAVLMFNLQTFAYSPFHFNSGLSNDVVNDIVSFDDTEVYEAFADIENLMQYVSENEGVTYSDLQSENSELIAKVSAATSLATQQNSDELALGIPSFLWGCVFGIIGVLVVYLMTEENKEQTKKAFLGCFVGTAVTVAIYVVAIAAASSTTTTYY